MSPPSVSTCLSLLFTQFSFRFFGCTNLQRAAGWHGGSQRRQVDVSALLPSLCLPESLHNKARSKQATKHTHTRALECCPHSGENANARMAVVVMKGNDPGRQAPSTRQGQGGQPRDKQTAYSPPSLSLTFHSFSLSLSPSILTLYQIQVVKTLEYQMNHQIENQRQILSQC